MQIAPAVCTHQRRRTPEDSTEQDAADDREIEPDRHGIGSGGAATERDVGRNRRIGSSCRR